MSSRVARKPIDVPASVNVVYSDGLVKVKGQHGELELNLHPLVQFNHEENVITVKAINDEKQSNALSGTMRALIANMVHGVSAGFQKKLTLVGVGYRASIKGDVLNLTLGFSHPVEMKVPNGLKVTTPSQTEIVIESCDKQKVGQFAAEVRELRPPEPYKGKGIRYSDEVIILKETKK
jgi:large subunit ribosomal protein L6